MTPLSAARFPENSQNPQALPPANSTVLDIEELLMRMRSGDRQAAAEFLMRYGSRVRRRIRGKLGPTIRRLFDSMEILSTLGRRLDLYVMSGRLQVASEAQLWSLLFKMADRAMVDKARVYRRLQQVEGEDSEFARDFNRRLHEAEREDSSGVEIEIENCLNALSDPADRSILSMWLSGEPHTAIAEVLGLEAAYVRKKWEFIKARLRRRFQAGE